MFFKKNERAFTLIELIVVMAVIGILVLLAIPKFMGYTKEAKFTRFIHDTKQLETASERFYMDKGEWPKLSDNEYTAEQIKAFAQKIYDTTGKEVELDPAGKYYDIDYNELQKYIKVFDNKEYYILQNPIGNVYALDDLTEEAKKRLITPLPESTNNKPIAVITMTPEQTLTTSTNITWSYTNSTDIDGDTIVDYEWQLDSGQITKTPNGKITTAGNHIMQLRVQDERGEWSDWISTTFTIEALTRDSSVRVGSYVKIGSHLYRVIGGNVTGDLLLFYADNNTPFMNARFDDNRNDWGSSELQLYLNNLSNITNNSREQSFIRKVLMTIDGVSSYYNVFLLSSNQYINTQSYIDKSNYDYWLMDRKDYTTDKNHYIPAYTTGNTNSTAYSYTTKGVRPAFYFGGGCYFIGSGTLEKPYIVN